jgi:lysophospholipase L1-like esterase
VTTMSRENQGQENDPWTFPLAAHTRTDSHGTPRSYVRFVALGDSATFGLGDPLNRGGVRGWAWLLADAIGHDHDVSFYNTARPGATAADVRAEQLAAALAHRPQLGG